jgi:hypothetical protein
MINSNYHKVKSKKSQIHTQKYWSHTHKNSDQWTWSVISDQWPWSVNMISDQWRHIFFYTNLYLWLSLVFFLNCWLVHFFSVLQHFPITDLSAFCRHYLRPWKLLLEGKLLALWNCMIRQYQSGFQANHSTQFHVAENHKRSASSIQGKYISVLFLIAIF